MLMVRERRIPLPSLIFVVNLPPKGKTDCLYFGSLHILRRGVRTTEIVFAPLRGSPQSQQRYHYKEAGHDRPFSRATKTKKALVLAPYRKVINSLLGGERFVRNMNNTTQIRRSTFWSENSAVELCVTSIARQLDRRSETWLQTLRADS